MISAFRRGLTVLGASVVMASCLVTTAGASAVVDESLPTGEQVGGVLAEYNGRTINLAQDWEGADYCMEEAPSKFRCVDLPAKELGITDIEDCRDGSFCLWDNRNYQAKGVELRSPGRHDLADHGLRDRANSVYNYRKSQSKFIDVRTGIPDAEYTLTAAGKLGDLGQLVYPHGGNWNNKIDVVELF
ncbi:peptidase inhibitor family I36 protein [Saccharopolyspora sp. 5N708]|uniref:peptidase inhibitor family I36 protein n=1 Tax=Saccharopolyspora sp. 5N708 TaxID=3457424 RepID=UPI003FD52AEB